tara:strand:- start:323 stop:547 length:225 start_codon:yes stop_codon:yes gene_type:complete
MLINATVSHELRNPLNSLLAQNIEKQALYQQLMKLIKNSKLDEQIKLLMVEILLKLIKGSKVQTSSADLMEFLI